MKYTFLVIAAVLCVAISAYANLTIVEDANPLQSKNYNSGNANISNAPLLTFTLKAEQTDVTIESVSVLIISSPGTRPAVIHTFTGTTLLGTAPVTQSQVDIPIDISTGEFVVPSGTTRTLKISGDFFSVQSGPIWVQTYGVTIVENNIRKFVGIQSPTGAIRGPILHFMPTVANFYPVVVPTATSEINNDGSTSSVTATFTLNVNVLGAGSNTGVRINNATVIAVSNNGASRAVYGNTPFTMVPSGDIADMSSATMKIVAQFSAEALPSSGMYRFYIQQIGWSASDGSSSIEQYWGLENFITPFATPVTKTGSAQSVKFRLPTIGLQQWYDINAYNEGGEWGIPGQVVSEGGFLRISDENMSPIAIVVFPIDTPFVAQFMQIEAEITQNSIIPKIFAPSNPLQRFDGTNERVLWPISNLHTTNNNTYTFTVNIGTFTAYGSLYRTGAKSCVVRMFWGEGATHTTPGIELDMLDKSPSLPFNEGGKVQEARPARLKFKIKDQSATGSMFNIRADLLIGGVTVEQSTDLANWSEVTNHNIQTMEENEDGTSDVQISIPAPGLRSFYRLKLNK